MNTSPFYILSFPFPRLISLSSFSFIVLQYIYSLHSSLPIISHEQISCLMHSSLSFTTAHLTLFILLHHLSIQLLLTLFPPNHPPHHIILTLLPFYTLPFTLFPLLNHCSSYTLHSPSPSRNTSTHTLPFQSPHTNTSPLYTSFYTLPCPSLLILHSSFPFTIPQYIYSSHSSLPNISHQHCFPLLHFPLLHNLPPPPPPTNTHSLYTPPYSFIIIYFFVPQS